MARRTGYFTSTELSRMRSCSHKNVKVYSGCRGYEELWEAHALCRDCRKLSKHTTGHATKEEAKAKAIELLHGDTKEVSNEPQS